MSQSIQQIADHSVIETVDDALPENTRLVLEHRLTVPPKVVVGTLDEAREQWERLCRGQRRIEVVWSVLGDLVTSQLNALRPI